jgi:hypothetical protein
MNRFLWWFGFTAIDSGFRLFYLEAVFVIEHGHIIPGALGKSGDELLPDAGKM